MYLAYNAFGKRSPGQYIGNLCMQFIDLPFAVSYRIQIRPSPPTSCKNDPSGAFIVHNVVSELL